MRVGVALAFALIAAREAHAGACANRPGAAVVLAVGDAEIPPDGGIVVAANQLFGDDTTAPAGSPDGVNPRWRLHDGVTQHEPTIVQLAPGLVVYKPPAGTTGTLELLDGKTRKGSATFSATSKPLLAAPAGSVKSVPKPARYNPTLTMLFASVKGKVPDTAIALVILVATKKGTVARSWGTLDGEGKWHKVGGHDGGCDPTMPGELWTKAGERVLLAWVDRMGRLSKLSRPITVQRGK